MSLTPLPTPPSRLDPVNFSARADAFLEALPGMVDEFNAGTPGESAFDLAQTLASTSVDGGSAVVGHGSGTVKSALDAINAALTNVDGNLNFTTLPAASLPVADADLMILRQGASNKKMAVSTVRAEFAADALVAQAAAEVARAGAEAARDSALLNGNVYSTEALGRAAVADAASFLVQGSGDVAAYLYRRTNSTTSVLLAGYAASTLAARTAALESVQFSLAATSTYFAGSAGNGSATGVQNTAFGKSALNSITTGQYNAAFGYRSLYALTGGQYNSAFGVSSMTQNTGDSNSAVGFGSLQNNTTGASNTSFGMQAGTGNTTGALNVSVGRGASYSNTTGGNNTTVGAYAAFSVTASSNLVAVGEAAAYNVTAASNLTAVGRRSAWAKTTGDDCTFIGAQAGFSGVVSEISTGVGVTAVGAYSFGHSTTGNYNSGFGRAAGWYSTTGSNNAFFGYRSGYGNTTGSNNLTGGFYAGHNTSTGSKNVMLGVLTDYYIPDSSAMTATATVGGSVTLGPHSYRIAFVLDGIETALSEPPVSATSAGANKTLSLANIPVYAGSKTCSARLVYRTVAGGENLMYLAGTIAGNSTTTFDDTIVDGSLGAAPTHPDGSIMLGYSARAFRGGQMVAGSSGARIDEVYIGGGVEDTSPQAVTHLSSNAVGSNVAGAAHRIAGGRGTGTAKGGAVILAASAAGSTGAAPNALVDWVTLDGNGFLNIVETTAAAVATPAAGSINLFVEGGALKFRNSAGTVLTVTAV